MVILIKSYEALESLFRKFLEIELGLRVCQACWRIMITMTFFHLFSQISLTSRKYFVLISLFCLLSNFLVLSVRSKGLSDRLIKMAGKRVWERKKRRDEYEFSDFVCNILDSLRGDGKLTNTYEKNTTIYLWV